VATEHRFNAHPAIPLGLIWIALALPTLFLIDNLPQDSELRTTLIIAAYFVAPALFLLITWSKPFQADVAKYEAEKERRKLQQEADRVKAQHETEERARDAELQARMDALRNTPPPRPSAHPNLGPEAQRLKEDIEQLYKK